MNAQLQAKDAQPDALTGEVLPPISSIAEYNATAAGLAELEARIRTASYDCTTAVGDKAAREDRKLCVSIRTAIETKREELNKPLLEGQRTNNAEAKRIVGIVNELEAIPDRAIKAQEAIEEAAKKERDRIKAEAQAQIDAEIARIANKPLVYVSATADILRGVIEDVRRQAFDDYEGINKLRAENARTASLESLDVLLRNRIAADEQLAEQQRQQEEVARRQAEEREEIRIETELAAAERAEQDRIAAENRERDAEAHRQRLAAEQAEADERRRAQEEADRKERERQDAERAELQRQEDDARAAIAEGLRKQQAQIQADRDAIEARQRAEQEERDREAQEAADREAAERAQREQEAVDKASLVEASSEALELLLKLGQAETLTYRKLLAALHRADTPAVEGQICVVRLMSSAPMITKTADAMKVMKAGGYIIRRTLPEQLGVARLYEPDGAEREAWQTPIVACVPKCDAVDGEFFLDGEPAQCFRLRVAVKS